MANGVAAAVVQIAPSAKATRLPAIVLVFMDAARYPLNRYGLSLE